MRIAEHIVVLDIAGEHGAIHPVLLRGQGRLMLVDAGYPMQLELIRQAMDAEGFALDQLTDLTFTHHDMDHIGSAKDILALAPNARTMAHGQEAPYIDGRQTPVKLAALLADFDNLPAERQAFVRYYQEAYANRKIPIDRELADGDVLPFAGGVEVLHTPGHMPGHICLFDRASGTLIAGDALFLVDGKLSAQSRYHQNQQLALQSAQRLARLPVKRLVLYHGGVLDSPEALKALKDFA